MTDRVTLNIEISNLKPEQAKRVSEFLRCWDYLGGVGASRKTEFYIDGDGDMRPNVLVDGVRPEMPADIKTYVPRY